VSSLRRLEGGWTRTIPAPTRTACPTFSAFTIDDEPNRLSGRRRRALREPSDRAPDPLLCVRCQVRRSESSTEGSIVRYGEQLAVLAGSVTEKRARLLRALSTPGASLQRRTAGRSSSRGVRLGRSTCSPPLLSGPQDRTASGGGRGPRSPAAFLRARPPGSSSPVALPATAT